jgi:hypothetical protein
MKIFYYVITKKKNDVNGNSRNTVSVYQLGDDGEPTRVVSNVKIGYRSETQAVLDELRLLKLLPASIKDGELRHAWQLKEAGLVALYELA